MKTFELGSIKHFSQNGEYYFAEVLIYDCCGNIFWAVESCEESGLAVIFAAIEKALGKEITTNWRFGNYSFQTINPTRQTNRRAINRCRVDIHFPFGDSFTGICEEIDIAKGLARAYIKAINSFFKGHNKPKIGQFKAS